MLTGKGLLRSLCATFVAVATLLLATGAQAQTAERAQRAPVIDGRDSDDVWRSARPITEFRVFDPTEDGDAAFRTAARIAYDAANLYVFVRAFDPRPDSIFPLLSRRDVKTASDQIKIMVDSYYDRRTGYEFAVNPAGVKRDYYLYDDVREDISWDAVWDVGTSIDSLGWTAEFRIPLNQLRYTTQPENTFGVMIMRDVARRSERISWPVYRRSKAGVASQFARVDGLNGLSSPRHIELLPYVVSRNLATSEGRAQQHELGGDARIGIGPNLTLVAAVNPDFGQVEADPAVLNLSAFEVSFAELRPFFVEGSGFFGGNQTRFYSRRIGAGSTPIDAAAKLTGRTAKGYTLGALSAYADNQLYAIGRATRDFRGGATALSVTGTLVDRDLGERDAAVLRSRAYVAGIDGRTRFGQDIYEATASLTGSHVAGSATAIARTQRSSAHYFQRPDGDLDYNPAATSLGGVNGRFTFEKVEGTLRYYTQYDYVSPGFESNDLGFLSRADYQSAFAQVTLTSRKPRAFWRNAEVSVQGAADFSASGLPIANFVQLQGYAQFASNHSASVTAWSDDLAPAYCDRCARGGPALRLSPDYNVLINVQADTRRKVVPYFAAIYTASDGGRSWLWRVRPLVAVRSGARFNWEFAARYQKNHDNTQWVTNTGAAGADDTRYVFGHLNQDLLSFSARLNYTVTPTLSLQYYAEPFVTTGHYSDFRALSAAPRSSDYDSRFAPFGALSESPDFNVKQFSSNAVLRWEYRPGSALYVVWQQGREQSDRDAGGFDAGRDYANLFKTRPDNTFLIKASYWFSL